MLSFPSLMVALEFVWFANRDSVHRSAGSESDGHAGHAQVLPLVKAFFVLCEPRTSHLPPPVSMRRRSSTSVSMDLSLAPVTSEASSSQGGPPDAKPQEAQLPFLR